MCMMCITLHYRGFDLQLHDQGPRQELGTETGDLIIKVGKRTGVLVGSVGVKRHISE